MDNFDDAKFFRIFQSNKKYTSPLNLSHQISMYCNRYLKFHMNLLQTHGNTYYMGLQQALNLPIFSTEVYPRAQSPSWHTLFCQTIAKFGFPYSIKFGRDSYEITNIYLIQHDNSIYRLRCIKKEEKKMTLQCM